MTPVAQRINAHAAVHRIDTTLDTRRYALANGRHDTARAAILLLSGSASLSLDKDSIELAAPALAWVNVPPQSHLRVSAGSSGYLLSLSDVLVKEAAGQGAESVPLCYLADRRVVQNRLDAAEAVQEMAASFRSIERELKLGGKASWSYLTAHLTLILIHCWRLSGLEDVSQQGHSTNSTLLMRFRHLAELHLREHWKIARYAAELGISHDRLHDICVRTLKRTPLELLHDRLTHEACLRLVRSGLTIEQVAADLGFRSTTHFSRFFRLRTGLTPARYRLEAKQQLSSHEALAIRNYADWP
ncbi:helix-turn-helix domain-containing protein [Vogesella indigofera]|uniref:Helix-turn-helix domain-containing protein n=1 Tax=Vogesella indigofera TaxID=45465 RepID=A0ABT5I3R5_VOGIN|nr:helix-turn-helix domain-containing protein [Vogesella indigofera]MDC7690804.1 helix-turn-helix domain-containing protein [Vogesella indigofera]